MRMTGHEAALEYLKFYLNDFEPDVDADIALWIGDGYLEWEPSTNCIFMTSEGEIFFNMSRTIH